MLLSIVTNASIRIRHLFISPGHNFFGHHGKIPSEHPMRTVKSILCIRGRGIEGDRFLDFKPNYKGQITFFAFEIYEALCRALDVWDKTPEVFRRNVITHGVDLNTLIDQEFVVQGIHFLGIAECSPCDWMDGAFAPGAKKELEGNGGLRAKILSDGRLSVDEVAAREREWAPASARRVD
ncbi:MAG TPA: molybdenum cofactor biosysynthesis protein [Chthoniobacteraceae bacterium]|nr:molybdenum cofactor biosysynthesis protein [Chthoniobacteraceae bacterium]